MYNVNSFKALLPILICSCKYSYASNCTVHFSETFSANVDNSVMFMFGIREKKLTTNPGSLWDRQTQGAPGFISNMYCTFFITFNYINFYINSIFILCF